MAGKVPKGHPLIRLFARLAEQNFAQQLGWPDADIIGYLTDVLPEFLHRVRTSRMVVSPDALLDLIQVGKRSYRIVSEFTYGPYGESAPLFRKLSENFELCVYGLGYVRADLDRLCDPRFQAVKGRLLG